MSGPQSRLSRLTSQFLPLSPTPESEYSHRHNIHTLSPTSFLPRAAAVEPEVGRIELFFGERQLIRAQAEAIYHVTSNGKILRRTYEETAARAQGLAYYIRSHKYKRVGILCPNTPAFLESIFGIAAAGATNIGMLPRMVKGMTL